MHRLQTLTYILAAVLCLSGCHRVGPQQAANRGNDVDSAAMAMTLLNLRLAEEADLTCTRFVQQADTAFVLSDFNFWYTITRRSEGDEIQADDRVNLLMQTFTLDSTLIEDAELSLTVGHRQSLLVLDYALPLLREGEEATLIAPYYIAYGREGNEHVEPLACCIIRLSRIIKL